MLWKATSRIKKKTIMQIPPIKNGQKQRERRNNEKVELLEGRADPYVSNGCVLLTDNTDGTRIRTTRVIRNRLLG